MQIYGDSEIFDIVIYGLLYDKRVVIKYQENEEGEIIKYEINMLGIFNRDTTTMVCTLGKYKQIKQFSLHKVKDAKISKKPRRKLHGFCLDIYGASGAFSYKLNETTIKLSVLFYTDAINCLREYKLSEDQTIQDMGDDVSLFEATVLNTMDLRLWLQGFGHEIEVVKPKRLREEFKAMAKDLINHYS